MASVIIHICIAKKVNEYLKMNEKELFLGTIVPDISKQIDEDKKISHFIDGEVPDIPNVELFLRKYQDDLKTPFTVGYYIHLLTDYFWFKDFLPPFIEEKHISKEEITKYLYQDYTSINVRLIDEYLLALEMFYEESIPITTKITEIPIDKMQILIDKMSIIIENSKQKNLLLFNYQDIISFIEKTSKQIIENINLQS